MPSPPSRHPRRKRRRPLLWISPQSGLFSGMALAGLLTVALTVTADRGNAGGIDGLRAIVPGPPAGAPANAPPTIPPSTAAPTSPAPTAAAAPVSGEPTAAIFPPLASGPRTPTSLPAPDAPTPDPAIVTPAGPSTPAPAPALAAPGPSLPPFGPSPTPAAAPAPVAAPTPTASPAPSPTAMPSAVALTTDRGAAALITLGDLVPGDSITRTLAVRNIGTSAFRYAVSVSQTAGTPLWTDVTDGLQLTLRTPGGVVLYGGPLSGLGSVAAPTVVAAGASDDLVYVFALPPSAANTFQGLSQDLTIVFTAVQFP